MNDSTLSNPNFNKRSIISLTDYKKLRISKPTFFIGGYNGGAIVEAILKKHGWLKLKEKSENFNFAWTELITQINFIGLNPLSQLVNHIPNNAILTNKLGLLQSLRNYEIHCKNMNIFNKLEMNDFTPKTFIIDDPNECDDFYNTFKDGDIWICKPVSANQGKGITLIRDLNKFKSDMYDKNMRNKNIWNFQTKIIQRYITNPLLIEGRKFDIRCFMLIASTIPYLVLFCPGYIRLSINKYANSDNSLITHLTNQFVQKQSPKYDLFKENTVWSIEKFNEYFNNNYSHLSNFKENWVQTELANNIKEILTHVFKSVKHRLANSVAFFELYGFDLMIDDTLKIWLIEANSNPSMNSSCEILKEIIPSLLEEVLFIAIECFEKNTKLNKSLLPLENMKQFQVLYCETYDLSKSRKFNRTTYKIWSSPIYKDCSLPSKSLNISTVPETNNVPITSKISSNDIWIEEPNKIIESNKQSVSKPSITMTERLFHKEMYRTAPNAISTSKEKYFKTFSGDSKLFENRIQQNLNLLLRKTFQGTSNKTVPPISNSRKNKNIFEMSTQSKLKNILKNNT